MSFLSELRRRKVFRVGATYLVAAWLAVQAASIALPAFDAPAWTMRVVILLFALGFPLSLLLAWMLELTPDGVKLDVSAAGSRRMLAIAAALAVLALGWYFRDRLWPHQPDTTGEHSVAVLPLVNAGGDASQQFFSDGLSENLIIALSQFQGLKVVGRTSSFQFRDSKVDAREIGNRLGVSHLLEGSVQHAGDAVRISAELIDTSDGTTLWSQRYDRPYKDLFALQDEIASAVAGALHAELLLTGNAARHDDRPPSGNIEAYNAYLQGLKHWYEEDFLKAAESMTRAVQLDPGYAMAWALLSGSWSTVATFRNEPPAVAREHMRTARLAADKALQLAPELGAAHAARAYLHVYEFDEQDALDECRRAVQLAPDDATILNGCGYVLAQIGRLGEAIGLRDRLFSIEPLYTVNYFQYSNLLMATGRLDESEKYLRTAEEMAAPNPMAHLRLAMLRGDANAALTIARQAPPPDRTLFMTLATQIGPDRAAADQWLADLLADKSRIEQGGSHTPYEIARIHALRGDLDQTLEWLRRSLARRPSGALFLLDDPFVLRFRDDPRLIAFYEKLGLPPPNVSEALSIDQIRALPAKS